MIPGVPMSTLLPPGTRAALVAASQIDRTREPDGTCEERNRAIDAIVDITRREYPQFFKETK